MLLAMVYLIYQMKERITNGQNKNVNGNLSGALALC